MLLNVLATALAGLLLQSAPGGTGNAAAGSASGGLKPPDQATAAAAPTRKLPPEELAGVFMARKKYREALEQFQHCNQKSAVIANKMGIVYYLLQDVPNAVKQYKRATRLDPHYWEAFNNLGSVYYSQKSYGKAIQLYKTAIRLSPDSAPVYSNLGSAYLSKHLMKEAMAAYQKALDLDPDVYGHSGANGVLLQEHSVEDKATFHYYMAKIFAQKGMNDEALQYIRKALEEGFKDRQKFVDDPEFVGLQGNAEFQELLKKEPREL